MGSIQRPAPVIPVLAAYSRYPEARDWAAAETQACWGEIAIRSDVMPFSDTDYYEQEMGSGLMLQLFAFEKQFMPDELPALKLASNGLEEAYAALGRHPETRPLNLDPGYLSLSKFVLATTKDAGHRLYLGQGIYGEVTLRYSHGEWQEAAWTYPNYRRGDHKEFLSRCREFLKTLPRE